MTPGWAGHQKDQAVITGWGFSAPPTFSREERGAGDGVRNSSCLRNEISIKIPEAGGLRAARLLNIWRC